MLYDAMMLIDSHCHLDDYEDLPAVLAHARNAGVGRMLAIGIGNGPHEMHVAVDLARKHSDVFAAVGIHPQEAHQATPANLHLLAELAADERVVAVGEIGLDYYHADNPEVDVQRAALVAQMKIAAAVRKPIVIHCRTSELATPAAKARFEAHGNPNAAWDDLLALIAEHWTPTGLPGIMHCFSGSQAQAEASLTAGFTLSFAGNLTYPKSTTIQAVARSVPAEKILVETDAPFLAPVPLRGQRNEPAHVAVTAKFFAELRGISLEALTAQTTSNFFMLFPSAARIE